MPDLLADIGRTRVVGVVNVTPDSFSDGGEHARAADAVAHGLRLQEEGADLVDVGGESTRPGAGRVTVAEELSRVLPVVRGLVDAGVPVSVDTTRAAVAVACADAGAVMVNDVSGGLADPAMLGAVAAAGVAYVAMHWRGPSADMQSRAQYDDVVAEVAAALEARRRAALEAGVRAVVLDPGLGFGKQAAHNWALVGALPRLAAAGPLLVGASRKAFLAEVAAGNRPKDRDAATVAVTVLAAAAGAWGVRVHEARPNAEAVRVVAQARRGAT